MAVPDSHLVAVAVLGTLAVIFFSVERVAPLRPRRAPLLRRLLVNAVISASALGAAVVAVRPAAAAAFAWTSDAHFGLVQFIDAPAAIRAAAAFVLMDLSFYYWHRLNHRLPLLWRFHNIHHLDPDLDVSTSFRFHFGEVGLSACFRAVQILLIGPSLGAYLAYEFVFQANTLFQHSNIKLPVKVERILNRLLVTPRMHGIHHSEILRENRSNFGVVFPWWDRIHRSLRLNIPQSRVSIGVAGYSLPEDNGVWRALVMPFRRQRDYWTAPDGRRPERDEAVLGELPSRMVE